jgi:hypothetical protein
LTVLDWNVVFVERGRQESAADKIKNASTSHNGFLRLE